jgi:hypothetical protein
MIAIRIRMLVRLTEGSGLTLEVTHRESPRRFCAQLVGPFRVRPHS